MMLQEELSGTESKISYSRLRYNNSVMDYNTTLQVFPNNIFASMFNFHTAESFVVENENVRKAVQVKF